jgi:uncharacterized protein
MAAFPALQGHNFMSLTTFRKSGVPVATAVWFAQEDNRLYVFTDIQAGKVKRIRHTPNVHVAPCKYDGEVIGDVVPAVVRILGGEEAQHASAVMNKKYGLQKRLIDFWDWLRRKQAQTLYLEIRPL